MPTPEVTKAALKGIQGGNCNRQACQQPGADWYNPTTRAYYCAPCARLLDEAFALHERQGGCPMARMQYHPKP